MKIKILYIILFIVFFLGNNVFSATFYSRQSGQWQSTSSWSTVACNGAAASSYPGVSDIVIICSGHNIEIKFDESCLSLEINGTLSWSGGKSLTVGSSGITISAGTIISSGAQTGILTNNGPFVVGTGTSNIDKVEFSISGTTTINGTLNIINSTGTKSFSSIVVNGTFNNSVNQNIPINGSLTNNGSINFGTGQITFTGSGNETISGTSSTAFTSLVINKGSSKSSILEVTSIITLTNGGLTLTNGSFKLSNASINITPFTTNITASPYLIPSTTELWCNGATINAGNMDWSVAGSVRLSSGTINLGNTSDNRFLAVGGSTQITIEGGTFNIAGRLSRISGTDNINFSMTSGTLIVPTVGSTTAGLSPIQLDQAGSIFNMSGGTIVIRRSGAGNLGFTASAGTVGITGGTLQIGDASSPASQTIIVNSTFSIANLTVNSSNATAQLGANLTVLQNINITSGTLNLNNFNIAFGNTWTNNGTFTPGLGTVTANGTGIQNITKTGGESFYNFTINKTSGYVSLQNNLIVSNILNLTLGNLYCNSSILTLGTSAVSTGSLSFTSGIIVGSFARWINSTGVSILFPIGTTTSYRPISVNFSNLSSGKLTTNFVETNPGSTGLPLSESGKSIDNQFTEGYWNIAASDGLSSTGYNVECTGTGFTSYTIGAATRLIYRLTAVSSWTLNGTHVDAVGSMVKRNSVSGATAQFGFGKPGCSPFTATKINGDTTVCTNETSVVYSVNSSNPSNTYTWSLTAGGGSITAGQGTASVTVTWGGTAMSTANIRVVEQNDCMENNTAINRQVWINPIATSTITGSTSVATNETGVSYSITSTPEYSYTWSLPSGGGSIASGQGTSAITINWGGSSGTYPVRIDATRLCGSPDFQTLDVTIRGPIISATSGNWSQTSTWVGGVVPTAGDYVEIATGHTVNLNNNPGACYKLTINGTADFSQARTTNVGAGGIVINSTGNITGSVAGVLTTTGGILGVNNANISSTTVDIQVITTSGQSINSAGAFNKLTVNANATNTGNIRIGYGGSLTGSATLTQGINSTLTMDGSTFSVTGFNATASGNIVKYSANANQNIRSVSYRNLYLGGSGTKTLTAAAAISGSLTIDPGVTLDASASNYAISVSRDWTNNGTFNARYGTVTFNGAVAQTITNPAGETFNNLNMTGTGAKNLANDITINFNFSLSSTLNTSDKDVSIRGNFTNLGTLTIAPGSVFNFTNNTTLTSTSTPTFEDVVISSTLTSSSNNINVNGNFTNNGTFNHNNGTVTFNGTSTISGTATTTFKNLVVSGTLNGKASGNVNVSGNFTNNGTFNHNSGTVTFNGTTATISGSNSLTEFNNLIVNNGTTVDVSSSNKITAQGTLTVNGALNLNSDASNTATLVENGYSGTGSINSKRYISNSQGWYMATPIGNALSGVYNVDANNKLFYWNEVTGAWVAITNNTTPLNPMVGYPFKSTSTKTINFNGNANSGAYNANLTRTATSAKPGWNLVGNPYPSPIDWDAPSGWTKTNVYNNTFWIRSNGVFLTYNGNTKIGVPEGTTSIIPAHQSFWVIVDYAQTTGQLGVTNAVRVHGANTLKSNKSLSIDVLRINFVKDAESDQLAICFEPSALTTKDPFDSEKSMGADVAIPQIYSIDDGAKSLAINTYPKVTTSTIIKLGYKSWSAGNHTISITDFSQIPSDIQVYLIDKTLGVTQNMRLINNYTFNTLATTNNTRFEIKFDNSPLPIELLSFTGIFKNESVLLEWKTIAEINNDYFIIQKSDDGKNFRDIGKINGAGNSNILNSYNFIDNEIASKTQYYRIMQVDFDGKNSTTNIIAVKTFDNLEFSVSNVFTDNKNIYIQFIDPNNDYLNKEIYIELTDISGKTVLTKKVNLTSFVSEINIPSDISSGVYIISIGEKKNIFSDKIVLNRD